jgi:cytoskeletal protein CcmA (bactofilin family)
MWGNRVKRKKDEQVDSFIGPHSQFEGDIRFGGRLHVQGTIKGNVLADNGNESVLTVEQSGTIEGEVRVPYIYMNGVVTGDVYAHQHIELGASARIEGNVYYNLIEMAMGAEVNGKLVHLSERDRAPLALGHSPEPIADPVGNT